MNVGKLNFRRFPEVGCDVYSIHNAPSVSETARSLQCNRFAVSVLRFIC